MIPKAYIDQWKIYSPWQQNEFVEQDLILTRLLIELYSSKLISNNLAFRGGTALHKLFLKKAYRYSEDLDFVQIHAGEIGEVLTEIRKIVKQIIPTVPRYKKSISNNTLIYSYIAEYPPIPKMKIKIEINTREHLAVDGKRNFNLECNSDWFTGSADIATFSTEELLSTKLRALYQRKKGRDLFDLWTARELDPDFKKTVKLFKAYLKYENLNITKKEFLENLTAKIEDPVFQNDIIPLILNSTDYDPNIAFEFIKSNYFQYL
ncbi:MAG: nucleotidyl transferase AbiEii/AbiGii toxin family protein [Bacteroidetes bacterium]|nr:nucleotidyl transferase AbiEii/AbiGii toxin family protein [Bacteroidota bacterium]